MTGIFSLSYPKSATPEPFGLVLSEAGEAGCAIIASDVDGIPEALSGGQAGLLVPPSNSQGLAVELRQLLSDPSLLHKWKNKAKNNLDYLGVSRVNEETLAVYFELTIDCNQKQLNQASK
jgi:glycosyltransferase involved in cell wall biosynthesis